ncbi:hypothetical protein CYMTET_42946 [Cymbomonas tetramitiformis]|uniref:Tetratricopeptide repeat protein 38 n=1 Tax=Cymbomonas tetramitiformis TaxID=36881 RepID=A0AAE0C387_9CHLO|nr:hypothetical protein CYMTET_42946 [Cymbomonas tetramitiformis]|eukprot:gene22979-27794_t
MDLEHPYVKAALSQQPLPQVPESTQIESEILRADSLWAAGDSAGALKTLCELEMLQPWKEERHDLYSRGIRALAVGDLPSAYQAFESAARENGQDVFAAERAVNIAFWMACAGKMLAAGGLLCEVVNSKPFAGGVLAFAQHMNGDSVSAEQTARRAIELGFKDPWTLHAVAHALYSLGRSAECAGWLRQHRPDVAECSTFMRTHMEFHLALCLLDVSDAAGIAELLNGPLWGALPPTERDDYWAATGVLAVLWKAELREVVVKGPSTLPEITLQHLTGADVTKSMVFSLCILRFKLKGGDWLARILNAAEDTQNPVFAAVAKAVQAAYAGDGWAQAAALIAPFVERLSELGASPEQREVVEEFAVLTLKRGGYAAEIKRWLSKHHRAGVGFYDQLK